MRKLFVLLLVLWIRPALAGSPDFATANQKYDDGNFDEARQLYQSLADKGEYTANLFYNLGNAEWRLDHPGAAALNYERALALDPSHPEARANLTFVREKTGAKIEEQNWWERVFVRLPNGAYTVVACLAGWVVLFGLVAAAFTSRGKMAIVIGLVVSAYAAAGAWYFERDNSLAIVTAKRAEARMAPADHSALADTLPAGSRVQIIAERGPWFYCVLPNRQSAWIAASLLERVSLGGA